MKKLNTKGFTLIEIVVVLMIASIVMVLASSLILSSMGYFDKTAVSDSDKQATDSISEFVGNELMFASDVQIATKSNKPEGADWHNFAVIDNRLYLDEAVVFDDSFYRRRNLNVKIRGYDSYRLDLTFAFVSDTNEEVYKTKKTLELLNLKMYVSTKDKGYDPFSGFSTETNVNDDGGHRIYYKTGNLEVNSYQKKVSNGTIDDELNCLNEIQGNNNRGKYKQNTLYLNGDFAYTGEEDNKEWYRYIEIGKNSEMKADPLAMGGWKRISHTWTNKSAYLIGDIIGEKDTYYQCIKDVKGNGSSTENSKPESGSNWKLYWVKIDKALLDLNRDYKKFCDSSLNRDNSSIEGEPNRCMSDENNKGEFKKKGIDSTPLVKYKAGDFVLFESVWYRAYKATDNSLTPNDASMKVVWRKLDLNYDKDRKYLQTDIIKFSNKYYQVKDKEIEAGNSPSVKPASWTTGYKSISQLELSDEYKAVVCGEYATEDPIPPKDLTVGGEAGRCGTEENIKGLFKLAGVDGAEYQQYAPGNYVYYNGFWYVSLVATDNTKLPENGSVNIWKKIDMNYNKDMIYYLTDVVLYNGRYWQVHVNAVATGYTPKSSWQWGWPPTGTGYGSLEELEADKNYYLPVVCRDYH